MSGLFIECDQLVKEDGGKRSLSGVSATFRPGITYLIGDNGAGKSTLLRLLTTIIRPTKGRLRFREYDQNRSAEEAWRDLPLREVRQTIGYLPQHFIGYPEMTTSAYLYHQALQKGISARTAGRELDAWLTDASLLAERGTKLEQLSAGQRQRVGLLQAMLGNPRVCLLDEPFESFDIMEAMLFRYRIQQLARRSTVIISTHRLEWMDEGEQDRVIELAEGRIINSSVLGN
ncbi:Arginine transport ATP-binding protein ArtM [Paenibacillus plantiphilus]|uniref:Arginine transport ATP-binding protein ArtM n=1 Tax=Paenibacillus plantiphilus TaxID=2905650 RepID=A0ABM9CK63_9BACL|nr:ATP-binding cassette domain-containing protein [Paenibacillus plantiphilus]CAH1215328.1 Arginine transport ATP-binding protein ArtM [Paenibacillus plantiphilus]